MLTVALIATFASAALWQQWRGIEIERMERDRMQARWILAGSLDWARVILREDALRSRNDHLREPWAMLPQETNLSAFLSIDSQATGDERDALLSGQITDLQSRLNIFNLMDGSEVPNIDRQAFERLFAQLGLPSSQVEMLVDKLHQIGTADASALLLPQSLQQLTWLDLPPATIATLAPHVTLLPERTTVNVNTASAEVLQASIAGLDAAGAQRLVTARARMPFQTLAEVHSLLGREDLSLNTAFQGVDSRFFEVLARLRLDDMEVEERSLLLRQGPVLTTLERRRSVTPELWAAAR